MGGYSTKFQNECDYKASTYCERKVKEEKNKHECHNKGRKND